MKKVRVYKLLFIFAGTLLLSSCENFLENDIKSQVEAQIEYANAREVTVRIQGTDEALSFISGSGDISLKPNDRKTIEFKLDSEKYTFTGWKVVNKSDEKTDCSSFVEITVTENADNYITDLKLLKGAPDLILTAECKMKPMVLKIEPAYYPAGVSYFRPIKIHFSQSVNAEDVQNFKNIKIEYNGDSIVDCFNDPELSADGKTLVINPVTESIKKLFTTNPLLEIKVTTTNEIFEAGSEVNFFGEYKYAYIINNNPDTDAPEWAASDAFAIVKNVKNLYTGQQEDRVLSESVYTSWTTAEDFAVNHIADSVFITCKGIDEGSGIKAVHVKETWVKQTDGTAPSESVTIPQDAGTFIEVSEHNFEAERFEYILQTDSDGIIQLDFSLIDYDGNESSAKTYYVIKDTVYESDASTRFKITTTDTGMNVVVGSEKKSVIRYADSDGTEVYSRFISLSEITDEFYNGYLSPMSFKITAWDEGDKTEKELINVPYTTDSSYDLTSLRLNRNAKKNTYIKVHLENEYGQQGERTYKIPAAFIVDATVYLMSRLKIHNQLEGVYKDYFLFDTYENKLGKQEGVLRPEDSGVINYDFKQTDVIYSVYLIAALEDGFYSAAAIPMKFKYDSTAKKITSVSLTLSPTFPVVETIAYETPVRNEEYVDVNVTYGRLGDTVNTYRLCYRQDSTIGGKIYPETLRYFRVQTGHKYYLYMDCFDSNGFCKETKAINCFGEEGSKTNCLDLTGINNTPPNISKTEINMLCQSPKVTCPNTLYVDLRTITSASAISNEVDYWIVENKHGTDLMEYSEELIANAEKHTLIRNRSEIAYELVDLPKNGYYTVFYKIKDTSPLQNYSIGRGLVKSYIDGSLNLDKIETPQQNAYYNLKFESTNGAVKAWFYYNDQWNNVTDFDVEPYNYSEGDRLQYPKSSSKSMEIAAKSFTKIIINTRPSVYSSDYKYKNTLYIYPKYFFDGKPRINSKNMVTGKMGYQIFIDQPTLIRTLYSKTNWGNDPVTWGSRALEADVRVESESCSYSPVLTSDVKDGYYYCVVLNFADGTCMMSEVKQR